MARTLGSWSRAVLELARVVFAVHSGESRGFACCLEGRHGKAPASGAACRATRVRRIVAVMAVRARPTRQMEVRRGLTSSSWRDSHSSSKATPGAPQRRAASASSCRPIPSCLFPLRGSSTKQPSVVSSPQPPPGPRHGKPAPAPFHVAPRAHGQVAACVRPFLSPNRRFRASLIPRSMPRNPERYKSCPRPTHAEGSHDLVSATTRRLQPWPRPHPRRP
jgi:hypothetical protein